MKLEYPTTTFGENQAPGDLTEEELKIPVKVKMWELHIKQYLSREWKLRGKIHVVRNCFGSMHTRIDVNFERQARVPVKVRKV